METGNYEEYAGLFEQFIGRTLEAVISVSRAEGNAITLATQQRALRALDYALDSTGAQTLTGQLLVELAPKMEKAGLRDEWIPYLQRAIENVQDDAQPAIQAELLYQLGFLCQLRARYAESEIYLQRSINVFSSLRMTTRQAQVIFRLAYVCRLRRDYVQARQLITRGFDLIDSTDPLCAHGYYLRGLLAYDDGDYEAAIQEYQTSLHHYEVLDDERMIALRLGNIGLAFTEWRKLDEAINCYNQSLRLFEKIQDIPQAAVMKMNLGNVYLLRNEPEPAISFYRQVESVFRTIGDELHLTFIYLNYGIAYRQTGQWQESEYYLTSAIDRWKQFFDIQALVNALDELAALYIEQKEQAKARKILEEALSWLEQIKQQPGHQRLSLRVLQRFAELPSVQKNR